MSNGKQAVFKLKKLNMRFQLVQAQESFINQAEEVGLGTTRCGGHGVDSIRPSHTLDTLRLRRRQTVDAASLRNLQCQK